jgi:hypothetical protein
MKIHVRGEEIKLRGLLGYMKDIGYATSTVRGSFKGLEIKTLDKKAKPLCICDKGFDVEEDADEIFSFIDSYMDYLPEEEEQYDFCETTTVITDGWGDDRPKRLNQKTEEKGVKHNEGKLPLDKVMFTQFPKAIQAVSKCSLYGHSKQYKDADSDWLNFKRVYGGSQTYADASLRHSIDKEKLNDSGLPHIFHKAWNVLAELELFIEENDIKLKDF